MLRLSTAYQIHQGMRRHAYRFCFCCFVLPFLFLLLYADFLLGVMLHFVTLHFATQADKDSELFMTRTTCTGEARCPTRSKVAQSLKEALG